MKVISGCVIVRDNKVLMVKEAKGNSYGQWNFPAGKVDNFEKITDAAIRETYEETGCKVKLTGVLPIASIDLEKESHILIKFTAEIIEENIKFDEDEILEVKWIDIEEVKNMTEKELRGYKANLKDIENIEKNKIYPLEIFDNTKYVI